ncbi:MAG: hypothetical protein QM640_10175 [Niabella sp.]
MNRRSFITNSAVLAFTMANFPDAAAWMKSNKLPPVRRITQGPKFHWFGYYDKWQIDASNRYALGMEVDFEGRSPKPDDVIKIGMIDLQDGDKWIELDETKAWCWQQGCMLQWLPGLPNEIIWNDRTEGKFVSHIMNVKTRQKRTIPCPIYTVSLDGKWALSTDFSRIADMYPGYGYAGIPDRNKDVLAPEDSGIWKVNLQTGQASLLISVAQAAAIANPLDADFREAKHYFNHLLVNPGGNRFVFLHRWKYAEAEKNERYKDVGGFGTRMITAAVDGSDLRIIDPFNYTSHFIWKGNRHILAWTRLPEKGDGFFLFEDALKGDVRQVGKDVMTVNGHCTYLPGDQWILNDTYPRKGDRYQIPYLYQPEKNLRIDLGNFYAPPEYKGEWRCDTHPRHAPNGKMVIIDSAHEGMGRQMYLIDISQIV